MTTYEIERLLGDHTLVYGAWAICGCGWKGPRVDASPAHRAHVAQILATALLGVSS